MEGVVGNDPTTFFKHFFQYLKKNSKVFKFTWKMQNVLKRMKNQNQIFANFSFRGMIIFVLKSANFRCIFTKTRKIEIEKLIFNSIQHIADLSLKREQN